MKILFSLPPRSEVLIFDSFATQGLLPILNQDSLAVFHNRKSELHLFVLLHMLARLKCSWPEYCASYLSLSRPKVVITAVDTNPVFYGLKSKFPRTTFISVQNGIRGTGSPIPNSDLWTLLENSPRQPPAVDLMVTFGSAHSQLYKSHIQCNTLEIGSARSNLIPVIRSRKNRAPIKIGFVSQFSGRAYSDIFGDGSEDPIAVYFGSRAVPSQTYFEADALVANLVAEISASHQWNFVIAGRRGPESGLERRFFEQCCGGLQFQFIPKVSEENSYHLLDECDVVLTVDSTLGYEMISRGSRVIFVALRSSLIGGDAARQFKFAYPLQLPDEGPFWTSVLDRKSLESRMLSVIDMSDSEWNHHAQFVHDQLMVSDPGNHLLSQTIKGLVNSDSSK